MAATLYIAQIAITAGGVLTGAGITFGAVKAGIAGIEKRLDKAEARLVDLVRDLPRDFVPRSEVQVALDGLRTLIETVLSGGRSIHAAAETFFGSAPSAFPPPHPHNPFQESAMSTSPIVFTPTAPVRTENAFERFIDKLVPFLKKATPVLIEGAEAARPILALTPAGPEYGIVLTGIETAIAADQALQASVGKPLSGPQKMAIALSVASPELATILASKGVTEPAAVQTAIQQFAQNVYNLQTGPAAVSTPVPATT